MRLALLTRKSNVTKEATHITINSLAKELSNNVEIECIPGKGVFDHLKKFKDKNQEFSIIHSFSAAPLLGVKSFLCKRYSPKAKTIHTLKSYSREPFGTLYLSGILNIVNAITVPTFVMARKLKKYGVKKSKIHVIHSHIDTKKFIPLNKTSIKSKYKLENKKIVLYYGSTFYKKGLQNLIKISNQLDATIIIAPRDYPDKKFFDSIKGKDNIKVITDNINVVEYVNLADVVVLPYLDLVATEGNPSCMLEAMACKTPVVTTNLPELREIVTNEEDVLMAKPNNLKSLQQQINRILNDPQLSKKITENAYQKSQEFDIKNISQQFIKLYKTLLKN